MAELSISLSEASGVAFYRQIVDQIAGLVRTGQLLGGERLPSFRDLASDLTVSLITVRRAYSELESAGLVVRKQGLGTFVASSVRTASRADIRKRARVAVAAGLRQARELGLTMAELTKVTNEILVQMEKQDD